MKYFVFGLILIFTALSAFQADASQDSQKAAETDLEKIDAVEAMAIANEWKWSRKDVKSSVTAHAVIFQFADGTVKKIPLPQEKMLVAVAPYVRKTHQ
jgi:succinate dehydrogenase/fumarate reductase flavoprotein subunit